MTMRHAFSLVELSIVLVILGLLTGGILAGQSLIRAAELRSVSADFSKYRAAIYTFRDKYMALPGDMPNATAFWGSAGGTGADSACFGAQTGAARATCNGNADGTFASLPAYPVSVERFSSWKHLANAGLTEGSYTGKSAGVVGSFQIVIGDNVPASKIGHAYYDLHHEVFYTGNAHNFETGGLRDCVQIFGGLTASGGVLTPEEAWSVDAKLDDGKPAYGAVVSTKRSSPDSANCTTGDTNDAEYDMAIKDRNCVLRLKL